MKVLVWAAVACAGVMFVSAAQAEPGLFVGVTDDSLKATPAETSAVAQDLGLRAYALTLRWKPGETTLSASEAGALGTATRAAGGNRVVLAVFGDTPPTPLDWRENYCSYVRDALARFPQINDVVIRNEPNLTYIWSPQFDGTASWAPAQYQELLARCYDVLHGFRPGVNVVAPATSPWGNDDPFAQSNISHSPTSFLLQLGRAYRASGRTRPICAGHGEAVALHRHRELARRAPRRGGRRAGPACARRKQRGSGSGHPASRQPPARVLPAVRPGHLQLPAT